MTDSPLGPSEMWPVYEYVCRVLRTVVVDERDHEPAGQDIVTTHELQGLIALTATTVQVLTGVGSLLKRPDGTDVPISLWNATLGLPPAYRNTAAAKEAIAWTGFWLNDSFHWQLMQWMEQATSEGRAVAVARVLLEWCDWQLRLIALLTGRSVEDATDEFLRDWREF